MMESARTKRMMLARGHALTSWLPVLPSLCRYAKLSDKELLSRLLTVSQAEGVAHTPDGLEAVVFTADGDMRQALNNLQVVGLRGRGWVG